MKTTCESGNRIGRPAWWWLAAASAAGLTGLDAQTVRTGEPPAIAEPAAPIVSGTPGKPAGADALVAEANRDNELRNELEVRFSREVPATGGIADAQPRAGEAAVEPFNPNDLKIARRSGEDIVVRWDSAGGGPLVAGGEDFKRNPIAAEEQLRALESQLKDLEAATQRQRAQLEAQLQALRAQRDALERARHERRVVGGGPRSNSIRQFERVHAEDVIVLRAQWKLGVALAEPEDPEAGLAVTGVEEDTPAARAGIRVGDRLISCNTILLKSVNALRVIIQAAEDQEVNLVVRRENGEEQRTLALTPVQVAAPQESGLGGGAGLALPGGAVVPGHPLPLYEPVPRIPFETPRGDQEILDRLGKLENSLEELRGLIEKLGISVEPHGNEQSGNAEPGEG